MNEMQKLTPDQPGINEDMALVESLLKMLSPYRTSFDEKQSGSVDEINSLIGPLESLRNSISGGNTLSPDMRRSLANQAMNMMNNQSPQLTQATAEMNALNDAKDMSSQVFQPPEPNVPSMQGNYNSTVQVDPMSQVRPQLRPAGMGVRPQLRPDNLGG